MILSEMKQILYIFLLFIGCTAFVKAFNPRACTNRFDGKVVRVTGDWTIDAGSPTIWEASEPRGLMDFDNGDSTCYYTKVITGLQPNKQYKWKVAINNAWAENYGCSGANGPDCVTTTNADGAIRFIFKQQFNPPQMATDFDIGCVGSDCPTTTIAPTTTAATTSATCKDLFANKIVRASGDWSIDAGSATIWNALEPNGLMTLDPVQCIYTVVVKNIKPNFQYKWKAVINNAWGENYGCSGANGPDCSFKSNAGGAIRFIMKPTTSPPQLSTDYSVAPCGDDLCEPGETCSSCPADCGQCPPPVCGDGICEAENGETFMTCPEDCVNELPGCDRFNDESCKGGADFHAVAGVENRRWQTPKPGHKNYQKSFQNYYALVGYADIKYTSTQRNEADICIVATHKDSGKVTLTYYFNDVGQSTNCKKFSSSHQGQVTLKVKGSDNTELEIPAADLYWNIPKLTSRPGDVVFFKNGQRGGVAEMFGWPHKDVAKECELLGKAGYLGVKLFPIHEQLMSTQPFENAMNPWYFMYQPVSYKLDGRSGSREELTDLIKTCRSHGVRVYVDAILNHFTGAGNDLHNHRNPGAGCTKWGNKTSSAPLDRQSPFYTHAYTYQYNVNTGAVPSNEFPGAALGPDDFHCDRSLSSWSDLFILNNGWLVGLTDIDTSKENVRERQAAYIVEMLSLGISGFRIDAAKHVSPDDLSAIFKKVQQKMGGQFPDDFFAWLEVLTGGESGVIWTGPSWYGTSFENMLKRDLGSMTEVNKIKMWDGLYPKEPGNNPLISKQRVVIQNDDHDQQMPGSSSRDMGPFGCVLVKGCTPDDHRNFEIKLFQNPYGVGNNAEDWPIRFILSSYYHTHGPLGIPDGLSDCSLCKVTCESCKESVPYIPAYVPGECAYAGKGYTKTHRDVRVINAMRGWLGMSSISGGDIGLSGC